MDDILIQSIDKASALLLLQEVLLRCRKHNITLSLKKIKLGVSVQFAGFIITDKGVYPNPEKTAAITNQLGMFLPDLAHMTDPLRQLLKKHVVFDWRPEHSEAFKIIKAALTSDLVVATYNPLRDTALLTDASRLHGLGYALIQYDENRILRLVQCGSRSLLPAESRYATIELECLAIQWAAHHCRHYLLGRPNFTESSRNLFLILQIIAFFVSARNWSISVSTFPG